MPNPVLPLGCSVIRLVNDPKGHPQPLVTDASTFLEHFMEDVLPAMEHSTTPPEGGLGMALGRAEPAHKDPENLIDDENHAVPLPDGAAAPSTPRTLPRSQDSERLIYNLAPWSGSVAVAHDLSVDMATLSTSVATPAAAAMHKTPQSTAQNVILGMRAIPGAFQQAGPVQTPGLADAISRVPTPVDLPAAQVPRLAVDPEGQAQLIQPNGRHETVLAGQQGLPTVLASVVRPSKDWAGIGVGPKLSEALHPGSMTTRPSVAVRLAPVFPILPAAVMTDQIQPLFSLADLNGVASDPERRAEGLPLVSMANGASGTTPQHAILSMAQSSAVQVAQAIATTSSDRFEISLSPEELGRVRIQVNQTDVGLQVLISGERPETLDLLRKNIGLLSRALSDLGYESASFHFGEKGREQSRREQDAFVPSIMGLEDTPLPEIALPTQSNGLDLRF